MKKLHEFKLPKEEEVEETFTETDDKGQEKTITTKIKKLVDKNFFLIKPNRKLFDEAELYYAVKLSEGIRAGLLTRALLQKRFANDGGILSEPEREQWNELYTKVFDNQVQLQALSLKTMEERTSKENDKYEELSLWLKNARRDIQEFEMSQQSLYDQTAENRARNKTILWWVLHLASSEDDEKETLFFGGGGYEDKIKVYDEIEEREERWEQEVISKFFYFVSFWYVSKTNSKEEFLEMLKYAEQQEIEDASDDDAAPEEPTEEELTEAKGHVDAVEKSIKDKPPKEEPKVEKKEEPKIEKKEEPKVEKKEEPKVEKKEEPKTKGKEEQKEKPKNNQDDSSKEKKKPFVIERKKSDKNKPNT